MNKWDKKAKNYSRYNEEKDSFEQNIFKALNSLDINFQNKTLLDVGCGTGVYTLHLSQKCLHVDGIDSSEGMLQVLKEDAKKLNLTNIKTKVTTWSDFILPKEQYDFALCTMSPAIKVDADLQKMDDCAKTKIYLGWAGKRDTQIIESLFEAHDGIYIPPNGAKKVKDWLKKENKLYQIVEFDEEKIRTREFDKSIENFMWHLDVRGIKPDREKIKKILEWHCDEDGYVTEKTINHMNLIVW